MPVEFVRGDLLASAAHVLVIPVNCEGRTFLNFPTKHHWRYPSHLASIEEGLQFLLASVGPWHGLEKIVAFPKLGCGAGGLCWDEVCPLMERYMSQLPCLSLVYL